MKRTLKRRSLLRATAGAGIGLGLVPLVAACQTAPTGAPAPAAPAAKPAGPTNITFAQNTEPASLDPHRSTDNFTNNISRHVYETLIAITPTGGIEPLLAESWRSVDPLTWEFKLRKGVKFHDGSEFTSKDVKFSFDRMLDPRADFVSIRAKVGTIKTVTVVDPSTIKIATASPNILLPISLTNAAVSILPADTFAKLGDTAFKTVPIGTGPYQFGEWVKDDHVTLKRFDGYWGAKAKSDTLTIKTVVENSTRVAALKTGQADIVNRVPTQDMAGISGDGKLRIEAVTTNGVTIIGFDTLHPPFNNKKLRQAINYGVDMDAILKSAFGGLGTRVLYAPPSYPGVDPNIGPYPFDLTKAKALLAEAGYPEGRGLEFQFDSAASGLTPDDKLLVEAVAGQLRKLGMTVKTVFHEFGAYVPLLHGGTFRGMWLSNYSGAVPDQDSIFQGYWDSKRRAWYYHTPETDALIAKSASTFDTQARAAILKQIQVIAREDAPWLFSFSLQDVYGASQKVKNWKPQPGSVVSLSQVEVFS